MNLIDFIFGRKKSAIINVNDAELFMKYIEENATRTISITAFKIPILSRSKGLIFLKNEKKILIRYNSEKFFGFTSLCYLDIDLIKLYKGKVIYGYFKYPFFVYIPKYIILLFILYSIFYIFNNILSGVYDINIIIMVLIGIITFIFLSFLFGNSSISPIARRSIKIINEFLVNYSEC